MIGLTITLALACGLVYFKSSLSPTNVLSQVKTDDTTEIKQLILEYCKAVNSKDRAGAKALIAWTPKYYWNRQSQTTDTTNSDGKADRETAAVETDDFERYNYQYLIESQPLAWKGVVTPKADDLEVTINGDYALVRTRLEFTGTFSSFEDFFVAKAEGRWKLFKIAPFDKQQTFPY